MSPTALLDRVKGYYHRTPQFLCLLLIQSLTYAAAAAAAVADEEQRPMMSPRWAAGLSILYTLLYVLPFYLSSATRPSARLSRDAPSVIRARIRLVTISSVVSAITTLKFIAHGRPIRDLHALRLMGCWPLAPRDILRTLLLTAILFAGPLFEKGAVEGGWQRWVRGHELRATLGSWIGWRNYIAGPVSEEVVFRASLVPLHVLARAAPASIVFQTPLYFGIAHLHHLYEYRLTHPHTPWGPALLRSLLQFAFTSVFGFYATFVFLRTASLPAVVLAHAFCNWCGLPRVWGRVELDVGRAEGPLSLPGTAPAEESGKTGRGVGHATDARRRRPSVAWSVAYYVLLVAGAVGFWRGLWPLTDSPNALLVFGRVEA
ncbi:MAG: hypothetical protein M1826_002440 [Phylliscum demangeonii]|nr:MAG: hypothetical protein M1826_002440 [Phylliscum demangeonii]